jgi:inhibitor of cysteine peptidase
MVVLNSKIIIPILITVIIILATSVVYTTNPSEPLTNTSDIIVSEKTTDYVDDTSNFFNGTDNIRKFSSEDEVKKFIQYWANPSFVQSHSLSEWNSVEFIPSLATSFSQAQLSVPPLERAPASSNLSFDSLSSSSGSSQPKYSTTNVQVQNVDEPDYLKTDGKYIYMITNNVLSIIHAYPAENAAIVLKTVLDVDAKNITNMFLNNERLVIFYNGLGQNEVISQYDYQLKSQNHPVTFTLILDVSDKTSPHVLKNYQIDGRFNDARMIDNFVYVITTTSLNPQYPLVPQIIDDDLGLVIKPDVFYFDTFGQYYKFNTVTAIDIFSDTINSETFLMENTGTIYVSENSLYMTYMQNNRLPDKFQHDRFFDVILPLFPKSIQDKVSEINKDSSLSLSEKWTSISGVLESEYNKMESDQKDMLFENIESHLNEYDAKIREELQKTVIHKISINGQNLEYVGKGYASGRLLNQFSMDEYNDTFRVATTNSFWTPDNGSIRYNSVYVFDESLNSVGQLTKIAPNESIFSARFIEDRLYLVTFEQIDPFFVIDLSQHTPEILGKLKIPGFSNYLHPFDENHIIGIGRDTVEKDGRVLQQGIKLALFGVSDVSNPIVVDEVIIGDKNTRSAALGNHKAFFFDSEKGVLSIPISGKANALDNELIGSNSKNTQNWFGFYVYGLDSLQGFDLKGQVEHQTDDDKIYYSNLYGPRSFYIDDSLYTVSHTYLKINNMENISKELNSISLAKSGHFISILDLN